MSKLLFADLEPRILSLGFTVHRNYKVTFGFYWLINNEMKCCFNNLLQVEDFLNWIEQKGLPRREAPKRPKLDRHLGCPSYPNCDIDPNGCRRVMGASVEYYGHRG